MAGPRPPLTRRDVVEHLAGARLRALRRARAASGIEQEWHTYDLAEPGRHLAARRGARRRDRRRAAARAAARSPSSPAVRWSWPRRPPTPWWSALDALRDRRRRGARAPGRWRASPCWRPGIDPFREPARTLHQAALRRHAGVLRPSGARGPPDDVELRVDPGEHRLRRRRPRWPAAGTSPTASARRWPPPSPARPARCTAPSALAVWNAIDPTRTKPVLRVGRPGRGLDRLRARRAAHAPPRRRRPLRARGGADHLRRVGGRGHRRSPARRSPTSTTTAPRCSRPCGRAAGSRCAGSTACPPGWPRWPARPSPRLLIDERGGRPRPIGRARPSIGRRRGRRPPASARATRTWPPPAAATPARPRADALDRTPAPPRWAEAVADAGERWPGQGPLARPTTSRTASPRRARSLDLADPPVEVTVALTDAGRAGRRPGRRSRGAGSARRSSSRSTSRCCAASTTSLMSPLVWDLAHIANYEELWLVRALGGARRPATGSTTSTTRSSSRGAVREALPLLDLAEAARLRRRGAGPGARPARPAPTSTPTAPSRCCATASSTHGRPARAPARRDAARRHPAPARATRATVLDRPARRRPRASRRRPRCSCPAGPFTMGTGRPVGLRQRAARPRASTSPRSGSTPRPVTNGAVRRVRRGRRLRRRRAGGASDGWAWRQEAGLDAPQFWRRDGDGWSRAAVRAPSSPCPPTSRCSTSAGTRPTPTPAGPASGCPPRPSGRRRPRFDPATGRQPALAVGRRRARPTPTPTSVSATSARRRSGAYPDGVSAVGLPPDARRRVGVDRDRLRRLPGLPCLPVPEYSEVFYGAEYKVLRGGSWATHPSAVPHHVPQLGLPDPPPDLRRLPLPPGTPADVPPPRLPRPARARSRRCSTSRAQSLERQRWKPRAPARGRHEPRRLGRRLVGPARAARAGALPHGRADVDRPVVPLGRRGGARRRLRGRRPQRHAAVADRRHRQRPVRRRAVAVLAQRLRHGFRGPVGEELRRAVVRGPGRRHRGHEPTPRCCSRSCSTQLDAGATPGRGARRASPPTVARPRRRPAQPAAHRRRTRSSATDAGATRCSPCSDAGLATGGVLVASEPLDDDAGWTARPRRLASCGPPATDLDVSPSRPSEDPR